MQGALKLIKEVDREQDEDHLIVITASDDPYGDPNYRRSTSIQVNTPSSGQIFHFLHHRLTLGLVTSMTMLPDGSEHLHNTFTSVKTRVLVVTS